MVEIGSVAVKNRQALEHTQFFTGILFLPDCACLFAVTDTDDMYQHSICPAQRTFLRDPNHSDGYRAVAQFYRQRHADPAVAHQRLLVSGNRTLLAGNQPHVYPVGSFVIAGSRLPVVCCFALGLPVRE